MEAPLLARHQTEIQGNEQRLEEQTMSKEKQIEEMAEYIFGNAITHDTQFKEDCRSIARDLYNAGYRKQSEGEWIVSGSDKDRRAECSNCHHEYAVQKVMLQLHKFPICPLCGAKMKGGAE